MSVRLHNADRPGWSKSAHAACAHLIEPNTSVFFEYTFALHVRLCARLQCPRSAMGRRACVRARAVDLVQAHGGRGGIRAHYWRAGRLDGRSQAMGRRGRCRRCGARVRQRAHKRNAITSPPMHRTIGTADRACAVRVAAAGVLARSALVTMVLVTGFAASCETRQR